MKKILIVILAAISFISVKVEAAEIYDVKVTTIKMKKKVHG